MSVRRILLCKQNGFTLIELLVVVSIIALLSAIGIVIYTNSQKSAKDTKRKADMEEIAKAYELKYVKYGKYPILDGTDFASGSVPKDPRGSSYYNFISDDDNWYKICASLEAAGDVSFCSTPSEVCVCKEAIQGTLSPP